MNPVGWGFGGVSIPSLLGDHSLEEKKARHEAQPSQHMILSDHSDVT